MASIPSSPRPEADGEPALGDIIPPKWSTPGPVGDPESRQAERLAREYGREPRRALSIQLSDTALNVLSVSDQTAVSAHSQPHEPSACCTPPSFPAARAW